MKQVIVLILTLLVTGCYNDKAVLQRLDEHGNSLISEYVEDFNSDDDEIYVQEFDNSEATLFLKENVPYFECPDKNMERTWYFRWWTFRKHVKSTPDGYVITEFLPTVPWAGKHNAISCPGMHHFSEGRWLRNPEYLRDYARYWTREKQNARRYSFPAAYSFLQYHFVHPDVELMKEAYPELKEIYAAWENDHWDEAVGLFWQMDGCDGMEISISGALSPDATGYRATINSYMYADALALAHLAGLLGYEDDVKLYISKADALKEAVNNKLWDEESRFYKVIPRHGDLSFSPARELHGYVPWMFGLPEKDRSDAWRHLSDTLGFNAPYGLTTAEQRAEGFKVVYEGHCCQWNGPLWPFATSQTLTALANVLHQYGEDEYVSRNLYMETLKTYGRSHRMVRDDGKEICWIDENQNPFTGDWIARTMLKKEDYGYYERGKDYNHSSFCDLVVSGLIGIIPQSDDSLVVEPLVPDEEWDWFSLSNVLYKGREIAVVYDRDGNHYGGRTGLNVYVDGRHAGHSVSCAGKILIRL